MMLSGKIALVTGATRGIGLACVKSLAAQGAHVGLTGRDLAQAQAAADSVNAALGEERVIPFSCDVSNADAVKQTFQAVFSRFRRLDILIANAGVLDDALIGMVTEQQIKTTFGVNTFGVIFCSQYASRLMARSGGGSIIALSSIMGLEGNAGQVVYSGSKAAVVGIVRSLAKELASSGIRVNAIAPGYIDTDMTRSIPEGKQADRIAAIAMGRAGTADEVAKVALFLASDLSSYVTGQVIGVDGGMVI
jgi:3-oxoacyl-[acyl-carrier protein] reductase